MPTDADASDNAGASADDPANSELVPHVAVHAASHESLKSSRLSVGAEPLHRNPGALARAASTALICARTTATEATSSLGKGAPAAFHTSYSSRRLDLISNFN